MDLTLKMAKNHQAVAVKRKNYERFVKFFERSVYGSLTYFRNKSTLSFGKIC